MNSFARALLGMALLLASGLPGLSQQQKAVTLPPLIPQPIDETVPAESNNYPLGPDSVAHTSVAAGKTFQFDLADSRIFPGTTHTITVYIPAAYHGDKPACVYVGLDGLGFQAATVFDNLIEQHAMPVTIAIGVSPGTVASANPPDNPRFDRSYEFDSRSDRLARFLIEEVLPAVEKYPTADGTPIRLSINPDDRAIGGGSTGAIAAFTVAWERPDVFRRVFSAIGTYVGMRGGEQYYVLVRKTEPKPLRIFLEDGVHDEWPGGPEMGDWWMSNQTMNRALTFAGYDVRHVWGAGSHNGSQATAVFPDAMRWLWRDWPSPLRAGEPGNPVLQAILQPGEGWQIAADHCGTVNELAANPQGQVFSQVDVGGHPLLCGQTGSGGAFALGADGRSHLGRGAGGLHVTNLIVRSNGDMYLLTQTDELWLIPAHGERVRLDRRLRGAAGLALSPDGLWLFVAQGASRTGLSYRVRSDGTVDARAPFYDFAVPQGEDDSGAAGIAMDRDGRAYVATRMGVQVFDRNGRVAAILPLPGNVAATGVAFGSGSFDTLYVAGGGKVYRRKMHAVGAPPWLAPFKLPPWGAG